MARKSKRGEAVPVPVVLVEEAVPPVVPLEGVSLYLSKVRTAESVHALEEDRRRRLMEPVSVQERAVAVSRGQVKEARVALRQYRGQELVGLLEREPVLVDVLAPEHTLKTCSDGEPENEEECGRCLLLSAVRGYVPLGVGFGLVVRVLGRDEE